MSGPWTPAPWIARDALDTIRGVDLIDREGVVFGRFSRPQGQFEEGEANVRLISLAPEMAELLELLVAVRVRSSTHDLVRREKRLRADASALLARARGETLPPMQASEDTDQGA